MNWRTTVALTFASLAFVPARPARAAADPPIIVVRTPSRQPEAVETARLATVYFGFITANDGIHPRPAWLNKGANIDFKVVRAGPEILRNPEFGPVRPAAGEHGEFYIANVFAKDDPRQKPMYLYLLAMQGNRTVIVRAFHIVQGRAQKIAG